MLDVYDYVWVCLDFGLGFYHYDSFFDDSRVDVCNVARSHVG